MLSEDGSEFFRVRYELKVPNLIYLLADGLFFDLLKLYGL